MSKKAPLGKSEISETGVKNRRRRTLTVYISVSSVLPSDRDYVRKRVSKELKWVDEGIHPVSREAWMEFKLTV